MVELLPKTGKEHIILGFFISPEWKECNGNFYGDKMCKIFMIAPYWASWSAKVTGTQYVYSSARNQIGAGKIPQGIGFGGGSNVQNYNYHFNIWISSDFNQLEFNAGVGNNCFEVGLVDELGYGTSEWELANLWVVGTGGDDADKGQSAAKERDQRETERRRKVDRGMASEGWNEGADKWMMDMMGKTGVSDEFANDIKAIRKDSKKGGEK